MIDYQFQHSAHVLDWRMHCYMKETPVQPALPPSKEDLEFDRAWSNYQDALYHGWIKR